MPAPNGSTAKYGFPYLLETDPPDVATASEDLAQAVENIIAPAYSGTASARPSAGKFGRYYYATDTGQLTFDNGTNWVAIVAGNPSGSASQTAAQSIGSSAAQLTSCAAAGTMKGGVTFASNVFTVPVAGRYGCFAQISWAPASATTFYTFVYHNGSIGSPGGAYADTGTGQEVTVPTFAFVDCAAGDTLGWGGESTGGPVNTFSASSGRTTMQIWLASQ